MAFRTPTDLGIGRPSGTLTDVLRQVEEALSLMADGTPIMFGDRYLEQNGVGSPPRVLFVPEAQGGRIGPPIEMGNAARMVHSCNVYVRAPEGGTDLTRYDPLYALTEIVISLISAAGTGRIEWGPWIGDPPAKVDGPGADAMFSFTFVRDIQANAARWALAPATDNTTAPNPIPPPGVAANEPTSITVTVTPES